MNKKKIFFVLVSLVFLVSCSSAYAAGDTTKLPSKLTYAKEWLNSNIFTPRSDSKVKLFDRYAGDRVNNIVSIKESGTAGQMSELSIRYQNLIAKENTLIENKKIKDETIDLVQNNTIRQQKLLSEFRQELTNEDLKKIISETQTEVVNQTKNSIAKAVGETAATKFSDNAVAVWRDPKNESADEKGTRVYAAGTTVDGSDVTNGVVIDGGQGKIVDQDGQLTIEYAPGTGANSVTTTEGKKLWKILQSDGTTIDSYTPAGNVVMGGSGGVAGNVVVNTVSGQASTGTAGVVVQGNSTSGSSGTATVQVVGGLPTVKTGQVGQESSGPAADPSQTIINSANSINGANQLNQTNADNQTEGGSSAGQVSPAAPQPMVAPGVQN